MVTERINIITTERGSRTVRRNLDAIGTSANAAARDIRILQNAFFVLGAAGLVRGLTRQLDVLTNFENRLRLTSASAAEAEQVQQSLFEVARRSRTEFESVAEIYSRTALSVRELGVSQQETLQFTESLAKATILSGAAAREANAALVQLAQGLASNRLSGDELRSVLEQLPFVADVIARRLNVTRGELRQFGRDGKISAEVVLAAFRDAREEIDEKFANTAVTIAQAFTVARTNFQQLLDSFDDGTGTSAILARAIVVISENLGALVNALTVVGGALLATFAGRALGSIFTYVNGIRLSVAASREAAAAEVTRRQAIVGTIDARRASAATAARELQAEGALLLQKRALLMQEVAAARFTQVGNVARNVQTGQFVNLSAATARFTAAQANLQRVELGLVNTERALTAQRALLTKATNASTVASARLGVAQAASTGGLARFGALGRAAQVALRGVATVLGGIIALLGGPITAAIAAVGALTVAFVRWGNAIEVDTGQGLIGLRDIAQGTLQFIGDLARSAIDTFNDFVTVPQIVRDALAPLSGVFDLTLGDIISIVGRGIRQVIDILLTPVNFFVGVVSGILAAAEAIPTGFSNIFGRARNLVLGILTDLANKAIGIINGILGQLNKLAGTAAGDFLGLEQIDLLEQVTFEPSEIDQAGANAGQRFAKGFESGFNASGNLLDAAGNRISENAARIRDDRRSDNQLIALANGQSPTGNGSPTSTGSGGGGNRRDFAGEAQRLRDQIDLERQFGLQKQQTQNILRIEQRLKRDLTETERQLVNQLTQQVEISKIQGQTLEAVNGPQEKFRLTQMALNDLLAQGVITLGQYNDQLRQTFIAAQRAEGTLAGGFRAAIASNIQSAAEFGQAIGDTVVGAVNGLADAFVEFAKTGKLNIRQVFQDLFAQLAKLAAQRVLLQLLGSVFGIPGGGFGGALGGGGGLGFLGFNTGGSIRPSGPGNTDSQLVAFAKRPDERVDVLTPRQQRMQAEAMAQNGGMTVVQAPAPNVIVSITPDQIADALAGEAGDRLIVQGLERNAPDAQAVLATGTG